MTRTKQPTAKEQLTVNDIRYNNKVNLFTGIVASTGVTRNDLAVRNNISLMTVKNIVDELMDMGLAEEFLLDSAVGRKPAALKVNSRYGNIVCINLSSINEIRIIIYDLRGVELASEVIRFKHREKTIHEKMDSVIEVIKTRLEDIPTETVGITALVPGIYYDEEDILRFAVDKELEELHVKSVLKDAFPVENIQIIHDTLAFGHSEYELDKTGEYSQFYLYCGEGVGGCFTNMDGTPVLGENVLAGEIGNILQRLPGREDPVRLESLLSTGEMRERLSGRYRDMEFSEVLKLREEDPKVEAVIREALEAVSLMLYNIIWVLNPSRIVVDSYCKEYAELILEHTREFMKRYFDKESLHYTKVMAAKGDEFHTMKWCMKHTRRRWIERVLSAGGQRQMILTKKEGIV